MNKENRQHLSIGIFVITSTIILLSIWLWFSSYSNQTYNTYLTIFNEPVDGLSISSPVKYNGVEIGKVKHITLDEKNPRNIIVLINLQSNIAINKKTTASLKSQGVTGLSYIELNLPQNTILNDNITAKKKPPYPQIITTPSFLYSLSEQAQSMSQNVQDISLQMKLLLSNENITQFSAMLKNLNAISKAIAINSQNISTSMQNLSLITTHIKNSTQNLGATMNNINVLTQSLTDTSNNTNKLISNLQNNTLNNINSVLLPGINQTMVSINQASLQLEQFINLIKQNPSALVRGITVKPLGPGENK